MQTEPTGPNNKLLKYTSFLLVVLGIVGIVLEASLAAGLLAGGISSFAPNLQRSGLPTDVMTLTVAMCSSVAAGLLNAGLQIWTGWSGVRLRHGAPLADRCQTLGILLTGFSAIAWIFDRVTSGALGSLDIVILAFSIAVPIAYYIAAKREERDDFWEGIKERAVMHPAARVASRVNDRFVLDAVSGALRAARPSEAPTVELLSLDEYERRESRATSSS